jgi:hypothetical protein
LLSHIYALITEKLCQGKVTEWRGDVSRQYQAAEAKWHRPKVHDYSNAASRKKVAVDEKVLIFA